MVGVGGWEKEEKRKGNGEMLYRTEEKVTRRGLQLLRAVAYRSTATKMLCSGLRRKKKKRVVGEALTTKIG